MIHLMCLSYAYSLLAVYAQPSDQAALRAQTPPPRQTLMHSMALTCGMGYTSSQGYGFFWEGRKFPLEIARLQQQSKQAPLAQRAALSRQIGTLYAAQGDTEQARQAFARSASLYAQQLQRPGGSSGKLLAEYALSLQQAGQNDPADQMIRRAVAISPRDWQVWVASGQFRVRRAQTRTSAGQSTADPAASVQAEWAAARHDFDTAVRLAPRLPQPYEQRSAFRCAYSLATHPSARSSVAGLQDMERAVALSPADDPYALAVLAWNDYTDYGTRYFPNQSYDNFAVWKVLPPANRRRLSGLRRRIERLTSAQHPTSLRARACVALAWLEYEFHDVPAAQAQSHLKQALRLQPDMADAEQFLMHTYAVEEEWGALVQFCDALAQRRPGTRYPLIAAYAFFKQNQSAQAEAQARLALQRQPHDPAANLFLSFLLLRNTASQNTEVTEQYLKAAEAGLTSAKLPVTEVQAAQTECSLLRGFYFALLDKPEEARRQFTQILEQDRENASAKQGLALLPP